MARASPPDADALAKALLHVLVAVESEADGVPEALFSDTAANELALDGAPPAGFDARPLFVERSAFSAALERLKAMGLCTQQQGALRVADASQSQSAERVVSAADEAAIMEVLMRVLRSRFVQEASWGAPGLKRLAPLAAPAEAMHKRDSLSWMDRAGLCEALGCYLAEAAGNMHMAIFYLREALELKERELGADHEETCHALNQLGVAYKQMAMYDEAEPLLLRAAEGEERHGSREGRLRAEHNLAALYLQRGQYAEAEARIKRALEAATKGLPADHSLVGSLLLAQANLLALRGELTAVPDLLSRALVIFNGSAATVAMQQAAHGAGADLPAPPAGADLGQRSAKVACAVQSQGELALAEGRLVDGEKALLASLAMFGEQCGRCHLHVLRGMVALGVALRAQTRTQEAEDLLRSALSASDEARVGTHPIHAAVLAGLASVSLDQGRADEAEALLRRAANISTEVLGGAHTTTAAILHNLAAAVEAGGKLDDAESLFRRALEADSASLGGEHASVARTLSSLGCVLRKKGQPEEARTSFERAHAILRERLGDGHPETARALANVGCALVDGKEWAKGEAALRKALAVEEEMLGPVHLETATTLANLGACLVQQEHAKPDEAVRALRRAAQIFRGTLGPAHAQTRVALAWIKHSEGKRSQRG